MFLELFEGDIDLVNIINEINEQFQNDYVPAIVDENKDTIDGESEYISNSIYGKLILVKKGEKVDHTWMIDDLEYKSIFYDKQNIYNLIIKKKYQNRKIYTINNYLLDEDTIIEYPSDDLDFANLKYIDEEEHTLLYGKEDDLYIYSSFFDRFLDEYDLWWEFEYINPSPKEIESVVTNDYCIDAINDEKGAYIRGTIKLNVKKEFKKIERRIKVWDYISKLQKEYNPNNYDDDLEINFLVLDKKLLDFLRQDFLLYGIWMYDKKTRQSYTIDIHDDYILLSEGDYNKMSLKQKNSIEDYCLNELPSNIFVSKCYENSQILGEWDAIDVYGLFSQKVGVYLNDMWRANVYDKKLSFFEPRTIEELNKIVEDINEIIIMPKENMSNIAIIMNEDISLAEKFEKICENIYGVINDKINR